MKTALITGITGQDGSYLSQLLLSKHYSVVGMVSRDHDIGDQNIRDFRDKLILEYGDLLDKTSIEAIIVKHKPDEIYNLAGLTFVPASWERPALTYDVNAMGVLRILELIRDKCPKSRFFQATSSKIFGNSKQEEQTEKTAYQPEDPYAVSKLAAHLSIDVFRRYFAIYAVSGILYNHESERRGPEFVTRKITLGAAKIKLGLENSLALGNLDAQADWGYAPDYVKGMWLMLQQEKADDYILATGQLHTVREVCEIAFGELGLDYRKFVTMDEQLYRPASKKNYYGCPKKAEETLGWQREVSFKDMIKLMVNHDFAVLSKRL